MTGASDLFLAHWPAPWLNGPWTLKRRIVVRALLDAGILEHPEGSNRGPEIDEYVRRRGGDLGSYWCAYGLAEWMEDAGAAIPTPSNPADVGSCQVWLEWARARNLLTMTPTPGCGVLYLDENGHAHHCGAVIHAEPEIWTFEGNTSAAPGERNGVAALPKRAGPRAQYFEPLPIAGAAAFTF